MGLRHLPTQGAAVLRSDRPRHHRRNPDRLLQQQPGSAARPQRHHQRDRSSALPDHRDDHLREPGPPRRVPQRPPRHRHRMGDSCHHDRRGSRRALRGDLPADMNARSGSPGTPRSAQLPAQTDRPTPAGGHSAPRCSPLSSEHHAQPATGPQIQIKLDLAKIPFGLAQCVVGRRWSVGCSDQVGQGGLELGVRTGSRTRAPCGAASAGCAARCRRRRRAPNASPCRAAGARPSDRAPGPSPRRNRPSWGFGAKAFNPPSTRSSLSARRIRPTSSAMWSTAVTGCPGR